MVWRAASMLQFETCPSLPSGGMPWPAGRFDDRSDRINGVRLDAMADVVIASIEMPPITRYIGYDPCGAVHGLREPETIEGWF